MSKYLVTMSELSWIDGISLEMAICCQKIENFTLI